MSEETNEITQVMRVDDKDWFLQNLVDWANQHNFSFGITLNVGGFLVSGSLIGGKEYFDGFGEDFVSAYEDQELAEKIKNIIAKNGELYTISDEKDVPPPTYIHLKDARCFNTNGNPIPGNRGVWWRGRISEVDGFSIGSLSMTT